MGLLSWFGCGDMKIFAAEEGGTSEMHAKMSKMARDPSTLVKNSETLLRLLSPAQQEEIRCAFRRFDLDGNSTMYVAGPPGPPDGSTATATIAVYNGELPVRDRGVRLTHIA